MNIVVSLIIILSLYLLVKSANKNIFFTKRTIYSGHGHRCYAENLNDSERRVVRILAEGLNHNEYFIYNNLILPSSHSTSTEIDHVVVSRFGIFVIETKDSSGWIFGSKSNEKWTARYLTGKKFILRNPLWQNYGHVETLKKLMPFVEENFINLVVFTGSGVFKTERIKNVVYAHELVENIKSYGTPVISQQRLLMAIGKLSYLCQTVEISPHEHISNVMTQSKSLNAAQTTTS
ncbi:MAG: nuclease-related domain-containing protein [Patescibacteria group bacterium]